MKRTCLYLLAFLLAAPAMAFRLKSLPYLQDVTDTEASIVWTTDKISVGWVEIIPDDGSNFYQTERPRLWDSQDGIKREDSLHVVHVSGLTPGTRYRYRVYAQEVLKHTDYRVHYGDVAATNVWSREPLSFTTSSRQAANTTFAVVNDIHENNEMLEKLIKQCDMKKTDFMVFNGDMASHFTSENQLFKGFMNTAIKHFASEKPFYYVRGNHETRRIFAPMFHRYFSPASPNLYFTVRRGPVLLVMLDTGEDKPDSDLEYAGITDYDTYRTQQAEWLKGVLESPEYREAPYKVIVAHIPPYGGWHGNEEVNKKFMSLLRTAKPDIMLCGHLHEYIHQKATADTPFPVITNSNNTVMKITADASRMSIEVVDAEGKRIDNIQITHRNPRPLKPIRSYVPHHPSAPAPVFPAPTWRKGGR